MNIYKISQTVNNSYDSYDSAIVAAETEDEARKIHPSNENNNREQFVVCENGWRGAYSCDEGVTIDSGYWATYHHEVKVELIGKAKKGTQSGVILASFNAG